MAPDVGQAMQCSPTSTSTREACLVSATDAGFDRARIERIFHDEGLPSLVRGWSMTTDVLPRTIPFLLFCAVAGWWPAYAVFDPPSAYLFAAGAALYAAVFLGVTALITRRPKAAQATAYLSVAGWPVTVVVVRVITASPAGGWLGAVGYAVKVWAVLALVCAGVILSAYAVTAVGGFRLVRLAFGDLAEITASGMARPLAITPVLILLTLFFFLNPDVWQVAAGIDGSRLLTACGVFLLIAVLTGVARTREVIDQVAADVAAGSQVIPWPQNTAQGAPVGAHDRQAPRLTSQQVLNLTLALVGRQLAQAFWVGVLLAGFLVLLGVVLVTRATGEKWIGQAGSDHYLKLFWDSVWVSVTMLKVVVLLAGFAMLYFIVVTVAESQHRRLLAEPVTHLMLRLLQVHAAYCAHVGQPVSRFETQLVPAIRQAVRGEARRVLPRAMLLTPFGVAGAVLAVVAGPLAVAIVGPRRRDRRLTSGFGAGPAAVVAGTLFARAVREIWQRFDLRDNWNERVERWDPDSDPLFKHRSGTGEPPAELVEDDRDHRGPAAPPRR
ncbi:hypothetical protein ACGFJ7_35620 [Actinoplanes sp. NPDC048988]|uniref:hypothetical protein n=1 Tax=Actinoplanes sp. NPDC048988 TaxID=3363901 RepID=UPI00372071ED